MGELDDANIRFSEAAVIERRVKERRERDRVTNFLTRASIVALIAFNIAGWKALEHQQKDAAEQRAQSTRLVCDTLTRFIQSPPNFPRDKPALADLAAECEALQHQANEAAK